MDGLDDLHEIWRERQAAAAREDPDVVPRRLPARILDTRVLLVGQALARDTQRLSGLPYVFPGGPPYRLSRGGGVLERWLNGIGHTIDPENESLRPAYHTDLHAGFPGRRAGGGDVLPAALDIEAGLGWIRREIAVIRPEAIICLGKEPAVEVLGRYAGAREGRLSAMVARRWELAIAGLRVAAFAAYHPSGAFQFPTQSERAWEFVRAALVQGQTTPSPSTA